MGAIERGSPQEEVVNDDIKKMDIREFRELGVLQELNRQFLHPVGLALEVSVDDETGEESLGGVWDYREDPEGILYGDNIDADKARTFAHFQAGQHSRRECALGFLLQPIRNEITG